MADIEHYFGIWARNANPSDTQVEAGTGAVHANAWHSGTYVSPSQVTQLLTNLQPSTDYDLEWLCRVDTVTERGTTYQFSTIADTVELEADNLSSSGAIQAGAATIGRSLTAQNLSNSGAIQAGAIDVERTLTTGGLVSSGAIQAGAMGPSTVALSSQNLANSGAIEAAGIGKSTSLQAQNLSSSGAIQAGLADVLRVLTAQNLASSGAIQGGEIEATTPSAYFVSQNGGGAATGNTPDDPIAFANADWTRGIDDVIYLLGAINAEVTLPQASSATTYLHLDGKYGNGYPDCTWTPLTNRAIYLGNSRSKYRISNITFDGLTSTANTWGYIVLGEGTTDVEIDNNVFQNPNAATHNILINNTDVGQIARVNIHDNEFYDVGSSGAGSIGGAIYLKMFASDPGNFAEDITIRDNISQRCRIFFEGWKETNDIGTRDNKNYVRGFILEGNQSTDDLRFAQGIRWRDGDAYPSRVHNNTIINLGQDGSNSITLNANAIQIEDCDGGDVSYNALDGFEKVTGGGDGCGIMIDYARPTPATHVCEGVRVHHNYLTNIGLTQTDAATHQSCIAIYKAKDCLIYSNYGINCRAAVSVGDEPIDADMSGNKVFNNTFDDMKLRMVTCNTDAAVVEFRNNIFARAPQFKTGGTVQDSDYNCIYDVGGIPPEWTLGPNSIESNPLLVGPDISAGSDAHEAGTDAALAYVAPFLDYNDIAFTSPINMGCTDLGYSSPVVPIVSSVEDVATGGSLILWGSPAYINGNDFGDVQAGSTVFIEDSFGDELEQTVTTWTNTRITFTPTRGSLRNGLFKIHVDRI